MTIAVKDSLGCNFKAGGGVENISQSSAEAGFEFDSNVEHET